MEDSLQSLINNSAWSICFTYERSLFNTRTGPKLAVGVMCDFWRTTQAKANVCSVLALHVCSCNFIFLPDADALWYYLNIFLSASRGDFQLFSSPLSVFHVLFLCPGAAGRLRQSETRYCHLRFRRSGLRDEGGMSFIVWHQCGLSGGSGCRHTPGQVIITGRFILPAKQDESLMGYCGFILWVIL